jgi:glycosyltransferase involved in cell wall biosynthesis
MPKTKILYFYPWQTSFIKKDLDLLSKEYDLLSQDFISSKKFLVPFLFARQKLFLLKNIFGAKLIICRFAGYHSYIPALYGKIFRVPVLLILGGNESHYFPSIRYGNYVKKVYGFFTRISLQLASHLAPVDESLVQCDYKYDESGAPRQGYLEFCPKVKAPFTVIHNGYDEKIFYPKKEMERKKNSFLTVALKIDDAEFYRKGIDMIFAVAKSFPQCEFTIIGSSSSTKFADVPSNVKVLHKVPYHQLVDVYSAHEFYLQLSLAEGFPNALCEAMLCGCIPIGAGVFGIPKIISDCGFILNRKDPELLKKLISAALISDKEKLSAKSRGHISKSFPLQRRVNELTTLIETLSKK